MNRVKSVLNKLITPAQSSFVQGRKITDNIVIAQEVCNSMRKAKVQRMMAMLIDLQKAYDRLRWEFLQDSLVDAGFPPGISQAILNCISSSTMQVVFHGEPTQLFTFSRGIRQGLTYLTFFFVLCMERLSQAIQEAVESKTWKAIRMGRKGPEIPHLFFADSSFLRRQASAQIIKEVLRHFCECVGHKISVEKTPIFCSRSTPKQDARDMKSELGFDLVEDLGKYLGVPLLHKRVSKRTSKSIIDRASNRMSNWYTQSLSLAGRMTLANSVLTADDAIGNSTSPFLL